MGFRKAHPFAIASRGAGPSYGNPSPTNSCKTEKNTTRQHIERDWRPGLTGSPLGSTPVRMPLRLGSSKALGSWGDEKLAYKRT